MLFGVRQRHASRIFTTGHAAQNFSPPACLALQSQPPMRALASASLTGMMAPGAGGCISNLVGLL